MRVGSFFLTRIYADKEADQRGSSERSSKWVQVALRHSCLIRVNRLFYPR
jgi:hypothetical protein